MSAIVVLRQRGADPQCGAHVKSMLARLSHRGERSTYWSDDEVFIGHSQFGRGSPSFLATPEFVIAGDMRLQNQDRLAVLLGCRSAQVSPAELVALAFARWGGQCAQYLEGDFALAIWDRINRRLILARDHVGVRPVYYAETPTFFAAASELPALLQHPSTPRRYNFERLAGALAGSILDQTSTSYAAIKRLAPASVLKQADDGLAITRYWAPNPKSSPHQKSHVGDLMGILDNAVRHRIADCDRPSAFLSGGLDSSSIATLAGRALADGGARLSTISMVYDQTPDLNERNFIESVAAMSGVDAHFVDGEGIDPLQHIDEAVKDQGEPFVAPGLGVMRTLYAYAAQLGVTCALDGHGGDEVISQGFGRLNELRQRHAWFQLWSELRAQARLHNHPRSKLFVRHLQQESKTARSLTRLKRALWNRLGLSSATQNASDAHELLNPALARRVSLHERIRALQPSPKWSEQEIHLWQVSAPIQSYALEVLDHTAFGQGVEPRYPFWDPSLVEFSLGLPSECKLRDGWPRWSLRAASADLLPPDVRWRTSKLNFTPHLALGLLRCNERQLDWLTQGGAGLDEFVNMDKVRAAITHLRDHGDKAHGGSVQAICRTYALARWLDRQPALQPSFA